MLVQLSYDTGSATEFWKHETKLIFMTQPRSEPFGFVTFNPFPLRRCTRIYFKMIDYGSLHHSLPFYSVSNIFHSVVRSVDNDLRSVTTIFLRNKYQFSIYRSFVLSGRCPVLKPTVPDQERCLTVERNKMNNYKPAVLQWCFHRPNKCSIRALIGSSNHSVTSAAESSLSTE